MASGGYRPNKSGKSEPKRRSNWQQSVSSDRDDAQSLNSLHSDMRINNWDLSDLCPSNLGGDSKRRKKSKGNPEREREQSLSMDSPPLDKKHYTTSSYSHTKITPSTLTSQRVALENLKQHMTFSDMEDQVSTDGERNNERQMSQSRRRLHNASFNRTDSEDDVRGTRDRHSNRNNNMDYTSSREQGPDSNEIVAHLMQIRDFTKQARSMLESMEKLGDRKKAEDIEKVRRLIINLQEQEQGYRGLLQNTLTHRGEDGNEAAGGETDTMKVETKYDSDDDTSVDLEVRTEESETTENSQDSRPRIESKLGIGSDDGEEGGDDQYGLPVRGLVGNSSKKANSSKTSEQEKTLMQAQLIHPPQPVQETEEGARSAAAKEGEVPLTQQQELLEILREKQQQLQALMSRQEELNLKRRKTEKKLLEAQTRDNKARASLVAVSTGRQILERSLAAHQSMSRGAELETVAWETAGEEDEGEAVGDDRQLKSNIVGYPESDDEDNSKVCEVESLPNELLELKRQLHFLRNEFSQVSEAPKNVATETRPATEGREQLQNKLQELQNKKSRMDLLLQELQRLHSQPLDNLRNNETNPQAGSVQPATSVSSNIPAPRQQQKQPARAALPRVSSNTGQPANQQARINEITAAVPISLDNTTLTTFANLAREAACEQEPGSAEPEMVHEMQEKLRHLKEVRGQLDQLRSLVQYYQGQKDDIEAVVDSASSPTLPEFNDSTLQIQAGPQVRGSRSSLQQQQQSQQQQVQEMLRLHTQQQRQAKSGGPNSSSLHNMVQLPNLAGTDEGGELSDEDNASVSHTESQWSHLGPWDDDPEIQEKVRKLRAAKEKLRQLQDLVAFVQQSPDAARTLPENLGDLAASVETEAVSHATQTDDLNVSVSEGEVPSETPRTSPKDDRNGIEEPRSELMRLRKERSMLLEIQNQLKNMHNQTTGAQEEQMQERTEPNSNGRKPGLEQMPSATVVTFASNDELYSKMRRQRILREELRSKKKELEAIMKKDRNKRQYSRNQDNQSDTVSLNTDAFGIPASVDATMATWGGSTVDNLENITEDGQERSDHVDGDEHDEDDGYPSDGIVQVEEEEEGNDSDDGTYTIERDARQRKNMRKGANVDQGARPKTSRGRQTYPQPAYKDKNTKKSSSRKQNSSRSSQNQRNVRSRQEDSVPEQREEENNLSEQNYEWLRSVEDKLSGLSSAVETLLKKSETDSRQLSVSLNQAENIGGRLMSPMQEQMLQLQNQSMMLSFGQLVQSLTHQQGDIQQLQHQMQALQLQMQEMSHEHSFHVGSTAGSGHPHLSHPGMPNPGLGSSNYNFQTASAAVGAHALTFNHLQMASPSAQSHLNNTVPPGMFGGELSASSPALRSLQLNSLGHSTGNLSLGLDRRPTDGASGLGASLSVNTGSSLSLPQQGTGFPLGLSNLQHQQTSQSSTSVAAMTRDFSQFVNILEPTPSVPDNTYGDFSNIFGSSRQHHPQSLASRLPFLSSQVAEAEEQESKHPVSRVNSYLTDTRNNRKYGLKVKKSESDPISGVKSSTPKVDNLDSRGSGGNSGNRHWERETTAADYRSVPGAAGLDGDAVLANTAATFSRDSSYSSIQFIKDQHSRLRHEQTQAKSTGAVTEGNTLFDTLRDTIYAEVASVISQNESRPHFLLELFQEMRQIDSDFMRQRTLYSLQELIRSNLKSSTAASPSSHSWGKATHNTADTANSEQTPSESVTSEDDEDLRVTRLQEEIAAAERNRLDRMAQIGAFRNLQFDYRMPADNQSYLSTPTNGCEESPFFQDTLGETVVEFDSLKREEEEQPPSQGDLNRRNNRSQVADGKKGQLLKDLKDTRPRGKRKAKGATGGEIERQPQRPHFNDVPGNSTMDQGSESSISDMPYARIDIKQLDHQIKDIMKETIPAVKEHMDSVCSTQLLGHIKHLVLSLTDQMSNQEFARFFQHQLASILEDTLLKYEGRKMRDCGEDLLMEISDVLFNELAFFRLMQDLEDPNVARKIRSAEWTSGVSKDENSSEYAGSSTTSEGFEEDNNPDEDNRNQDGGTDKTQENSDARRELRMTESELEELGRDRDDEMATEIGIRDSEEKDDDESEHPYKIELAPSETKPFTRIGSDEDDDEVDEEQSMDDPSETAVSRDSLLQLEINGQSQPPLSTRPETEGAHGDGAEKHDLEKPISPRKVGQVTAVKLQEGGDSADVPSINNTSSVADRLQINGTVNGQNNNGSDEELTIDDLPEQLTIPLAPSASSADNNTTELRCKYEQEEEKFN